MPCCSSGAVRCRGRIAGEWVVDSLLGGVRYVSGRPPLLGSMALDLFAVFFGGAVALCRSSPPTSSMSGPVGLGLLRTAPSVGALLVMIVASRWPPTATPDGHCCSPSRVSALSMIVFGLSTTFALSLVALFFSGVTNGISMINDYNTYFPEAEWAASSNPSAPSPMAETSSTT